MRKSTSRFIPALISLALLLALGPAAAAASPVLTLPDGLKTVETEAFCGDTSLREVVIPDGTESIGPRAFADSGVTWISIPDSVTAIGEGAFSGAENVTIISSARAFAHGYATENGLAWLTAVLPKPLDHVHRWQPVYTTVHHEAETMQDYVVDVPATPTVVHHDGYYACNVCEFTTTISDEIGGHSFDTSHGYHVVSSWDETVWSGEQGHYETVVIKEAYDEEVVAYYGCSCGAKKWPDGHTHDWQPVYQTVHHDAVTETQEIGHHTCNRCGYQTTSREEMGAHMKASRDSATWEQQMAGEVCGGFSSWFETKTVTISEAYDEQVLTGYTCVCGAWKEP